MKIIFLDVDGVLNHSGTEGWKTTKDAFVLDDECLKQLSRILISTDAKIVLSSTWRLSTPGCNILNATIEPFSRIIGKTPYPNPLRKSNERKDKKLSWLHNFWPY